MREQFGDEQECTAHMLTSVDAAPVADIDAGLPKDDAGRIIGVPFGLIPPGPMWWAGIVVRLAEDGQIHAVPDKLNKVNIARIGGNDGRYSRPTQAVSPSSPSPTWPGTRMTTTEALDMEAFNSFNHHSYGVAGPTVLVGGQLNQHQPIR